MRRGLHRRSSIQSSPCLSPFFCVTHAISVHWTATWLHVRGKTVELNIPRRRNVYDQAANKISRTFSCGPPADLNGVLFCATIGERRPAAAIVFHVGTGNTAPAGDCIVLYSKQDTSQECVNSWRMFIRNVDKYGGCTYS